MSFYPLYGGTDEEAYMSHRFVLASQSDVMEMARLSRSATEIHPSLIRFPTTREVGMYQELNTVFGPQCPPNQQIHHQGSFENEDVYQHHAQGIQIPHQDYLQYGVGQSMPGHNTYPSNLYDSNGDLRNSSSQMGLAPPPYQEDTTLGSLPGVVSHPDLQWLVTTSNVDMRTLTPPNTVPSAHLSRSHGSTLDDTSSASTATISHHQLLQHSYHSRPPPLQKVTKKGNPNAPPKTKGTPGRKRKFQDHELSPTEAAKRHVRRERNKVAAAKCRNRRRELTDRLQGETDHLEDNQTHLHQEIMQLQQQKEHLEFILATHSPTCKAGVGDKFIPTQSVQLSGNMEDMLVPPPEVMEDLMASRESMLQQQNYYLHMHQQQSPRAGAPVSVIQSAPSSMRQMPQPDMSNNKLANFSNQGQSFDSTSSDRFPNMNLEFVDAPLNTPVCSLATPSNSTSVFTFPTTPGLTNTVTSTFSFSSDYQASRQTMTPSFTAMSDLYPPQQQQQQLTCAQAHRRSSSSESPDCVQSPKLIAL